MKDHENDDAKQAGRYAAGGVLPDVGHGPCADCVPDPAPPGAILRVAYGVLYLAMVAVTTGVIVTHGEALWAALSAWIGGVMFMLIAQDARRVLRARARRRGHRVAPGNYPGTRDVRARPEPRLRSA